MNNWMTLMCIMILSVGVSTWTWRVQAAPPDSVRTGSNKRIETTIEGFAGTWASKRQSQLKGNSVGTHADGCRITSAMPAESRCLLAQVTGNETALSTLAATTQPIRPPMAPRVSNQDTQSDSKRLRSASPEVRAGLKDKNYPLAMPREWPIRTTYQRHDSRHGIDESPPTFHIGGDIKVAYLETLGDRPGFRRTAYPMQTDVSLTYRPLNPKQADAQRVTTQLGLGFEGPEDNAFDTLGERFAVREWYVLYDGLPYGTYLRAGRSIPTHGWQLKQVGGLNHTDSRDVDGSGLNEGFARQERTALGRSMTQDNAYTSIDLGLQFSDLYVFVSGFNLSETWDSPVDTDAGFAVVMATGWKTTGWQAGVSTIHGQKDAQTEAEGWASTDTAIQWSLDARGLGVSLPLVYWGEYVIQHQTYDDSEAATRLAAMHEVDYVWTDDFSLMTRYEWQDPNVDYRYDTQHRLSFGLDWKVLNSLELRTRYRHNWRHTEDRFEADGDDILLILHGWY